MINFIAIHGDGDKTKEKNLNGENSKEKLKKQKKKNQLKLLITHFECSSTLHKQSFAFLTFFVKQALLLLKSRREQTRTKITKGVDYTILTTEKRL